LRNDKADVLQEILQTYPKFAADLRISQFGKKLSPVETAEWYNASEAVFKVLYAALPAAKDIFEALRFRQWDRAVLLATQGCTAADSDSDSDSDYASAHHSFLTTYARGRCREFIPLALDQSAPLECIQALVAEYRTELGEMEEVGANALHAELSTKCRPEVIEFLLQAFPSSASRSVGKYKYRALHVAVSRGEICTEEIVAMLIASYPDSVSRLCREGNTALHLALTHLTPLGTIRRLIAANPRAAGQRNQSKMLPIHIFLDYSYSDPSMEILGLLLTACPDSAIIGDSKQWLPLHLALKHNYQVEMIRAIVDCGSRGPEALGMFDGKGSLPLHRALLAGAPLGVIQLLLETRPNSAEVVTKKKKARLPLHIAVDEQAAEGVVEALLDIYIDAWDMTDPKSGHMPLALALSSRRPRKDIVLALLLGEPYGMTGKSWISLLDCKTLPEGDCAGIVEHVFDKLPWDKISELCHYKDKSGREAITIAHAHVQVCMRRYLHFCGRYALSSGPPIHVSATSRVVHSVDHGNPTWIPNTSTLLQSARPVVLKFMRYKEQWDRERSFRDTIGADNTAVVAILRTHSLDSDEVSLVYGITCMPCLHAMFSACCLLSVVDMSMSYFNQRIAHCMSVCVLSFSRGIERMRLAAAWAHTPSYWCYSRPTRA
jgi:ankyrin repeat protein